MAGLKDELQSKAGWAALAAEDAKARAVAKLEELLLDLKSSNATD